jgi:ketosteroid isomerase-like protein
MPFMEETPPRTKSIRKGEVMATQEERLVQVRRANERFYRAFESLDINLMKAVWVQTDEAQCVHPGWALLEGWEAISKSWAAIFANTHYMRFHITDVSVHLYGDVAWVTCIENLANAPGSTHTSRILATNVYEQHDDDWFIVHHHASPVLQASPSFREPDDDDDLN